MPSSTLARMLSAIWRWLDVDKKQKPILRASPQLKRKVREQLAAEQAKAEVEPSNVIPFRRKPKCV